MQLDTNLSLHSSQLLKVSVSLMLVKIMDL